jgi:hypothetical protein
VAASRRSLGNLCIGRGVDTKKGVPFLALPPLNRGAPSNLLAYFIPGSLFTRFCLAVLLNFCVYQTPFLIRLASIQISWFFSSLNLPLDFSGLPHQ